MKNLILFLMPMQLFGQVIDNKDSVVCNIAYPYYQSVNEVSDTSWLIADPVCMTEYTFDIVGPLVTQVFIRKGGQVVFESLIYGSDYWGAPYSGYIEYDNGSLIVVNGGPYSIPPDFRFRNFGTTFPQVEYLGRFTWEDDEPFEIGVANLFQDRLGGWYSWRPKYEIYSHCIELEFEMTQVIETCDMPETRYDTTTNGCDILIIDSLYVGTPDTVIYRYWDKQYNDTTYWTGPNDFGCEFTVTTIWVGTGDATIMYYNLSGQMIIPDRPGIYIREKRYEWGRFCDKVFLSWSDINLK